MAKNSFKVKKQAGVTAGKIMRSTPAELEAKVREYLEPAGIYSTREIAEGLKRNRGAVYRACRRLYSAEILRLSSIPKTIYRFALTGELLHGDNFPVITRLIAKVRIAAKESGSLRARLPKIFAELRSVSQLKTSSRLNCIDRCKRAAEAITSNKELLQQMSLRPIQTKLIRWWPRALENEYIEPMQDIAEKLDKTRIQRSVHWFQQLYRAGSAQAGRNPSVEEKDAKKIILQTQEAWRELMELLKAAGVEKFLAQRGSQLSRIAATETILRDDLKVTTETELKKRLEKARSIPLNEDRFHSDLLLRIDPQLLSKILDSLGSAMRTRRNRWGWKRWLISSVQIAWGGALIGFDLSLAFGGIITGVGLSVEGTNVGVALALATSVHAGGKTALDAIKEMIKELENFKKD